MPQVAREPPHVKQFWAAGRGTCPGTFRNSFIAGLSLPVSSVCCREMNIPKKLSTHPVQEPSKTTGLIPPRLGPEAWHSKLSVGVASALPQAPYPPPSSRLSLTGCKCEVINGCHFPPPHLGICRQLNTALPLEGNDCTPVPSLHGRVS